MQKKIVKCVLVFSLIIATYSCGNDDDNNDVDNDSPNAGVTLPADKVTAYTGNLVYTPSTGNQIVNLSGTATISGSSSNYTISFSDNVPSISGITFALISDEYVYVNVTNSEQGVNISEDNQLSIGYIKDGNEIAFSSN